MNPFHLLHMKGNGRSNRDMIDIRGFDIAVFFRADLRTKKTTVVSVNFFSRGSNPVETVIRRILHSLDAGGTAMMERNPFWVHSMYISLILQWWKTALVIFKDELIVHVRTAPTPSLITC